VAVFKDELVNLWPNDEDARRLSRQAFHFSEFMAVEAKQPPRLEGKVLLHGHCHHKATGGVAPEQELLERMGLEVEELEAGCCGMAGGWGYEHGHYDVSVACGERVLLPKVREAAPETLIVADGFSCRSQIEQADTGRQALHAAQVLQLARAHGPGGAGIHPERMAAGPPAASLGRRVTRAATVAGLGAVAGAAAFAVARR
jgi:Fe-S oxidoreductase